METLTGFERDLLYVVAGREDSERTGLKLKQDLEEYYGKEILHGRLYPNLDTLVEKGLLEKEQANRRTNFFRITEKGLRLLENRRDWENQQLGATRTVEMRGSQNSNSK